MLLGRKLLVCATLDVAVKLLDISKRAGAFHMTLAQRGDPRFGHHRFCDGATSLTWRVYDKVDAEPRFTFDNALAPSVATSLHGGA